MPHQIHTCVEPMKVYSFLTFFFLSHSFVFFGWEVGNKQLYYLLSGIGRAYLPSIPCPPWKRTEFLAPFNGSRYLSWGNSSLIRLQIMMFLLYMSYLWDFFFLTYLLNAQRQCTDEIFPGQTLHAIQEHTPADHWCILDHIYDSSCVNIVHGATGVAPIQP